MDSIPDDLLELQARFDQWRANRKYNREPIPDQLRDAALEMSRRYPSSLLRPAAPLHFTEESVMNLFHRWFCRTSFWKKALANKIIPWALKDVELGDDVLEVGPGPGMTTDILRDRTPRLTSIEIDPRLADALKYRLQNTNVTVVEGDATAMPFADGSFSGAVSFTMLHHVPSPALQDRLLAEVYRVLKPGGLFAGSDSRWSVGFRLIHLWDTMVIVKPETFAARLAAVGFTDVSVKVAKQAFRFRARHP